jgi:cbb3-type cytochrome oxidase subunit 3
MDPVTVSARDGIFAAFVVVMAGFIGGIVWWFLKSKDKTDANAQEVNKALLDLSMRTIEKVGTSVEKVGDNIEKQTGQMQALTDSTRRIESKFDDHGRRLDEHSGHLEAIRKSLGAKQA